MFQLHLCTFLLIQILQLIDKVDCSLIFCQLACLQQAFRSGTVEGSLLVGLVHWIANKIANDLTFGNDLNQYIIF